MSKKDFCKECVQIGEGWTKLSMHMMGILDSDTALLANERRKICDEWQT